MGTRGPGSWRLEARCLHCGQPEILFVAGGVLRPPTSRSGCSSRRTCAYADRRPAISLDLPDPEGRFAIGEEDLVGGQRPDAASILPRFSEHAQARVRGKEPPAQAAELAGPLYAGLIVERAGKVERVVCLPRRGAGRWLAGRPVIWCCRLRASPPPRTLRARSRGRARTRSRLGQGLRVNGERATEHVLQLGDVVAINDYALTLVLDREPLDRGRSQPGPPLRHAGSAGHLTARARRSPFESMPERDLVTESDDEDHFWDLGEGTARSCRDKPRRRPGVRRGVWARALPSRSFSAAKTCRRRCVPRCASWARRRCACPQSSGSGACSSGREGSRGTPCERVTRGSARVRAPTTPSRRAPHRPGIRPHVERLRRAVRLARLRGAHAEGLVDHPLVAAQRSRLAGEHVARERAAGRQQLGRRDHAVHQPPALGLLGAQVVAGERELLGARRCRSARGSFWTEAPAGHDADARVRVGEARLASSAISTSQASASSKPPVMAKPLIAPMIGLLEARRCAPTTSCASAATRRSRPRLRPRRRAPSGRARRRTRGPRR